MRRVASSLGILLVVGVVSAFLAIGPIRRGVTRPINYWPMNDLTLGVVATSGPTIQCGVASVQESSEAITVAVECQEPLLGPQEGSLKIHVFQVALESPVGGRVVLDGFGNPAELCEHPGIDCQLPR